MANGGSGYYPGVDPDGKTPGGIQVAGGVDAAEVKSAGSVVGYQQLPVTVFCSSLSIPNGVETTLANLSLIAPESPKWVINPITSQIAPPVRGQIAMRFTIPILSSADKGDIVFREIVDAGTEETFTFSVPASSHFTLVGFQYDRLFVGDVVSFTLLQSSGSDWALDGAAFIEMHYLSYG